MTDEIDVFEIAREPKPWWGSRPSDALVREIVSFIQRTGKPYLWAGQTYNKPDKNSPPVYLAEFHLHTSKPLSPCPCCTPRHGKYRHGMVAYFPHERVIRIMGHDCFKSINSEQHAEALATYHQEITRKNNITYLLANLDKVPELLAVVEHNAPAGHALDDVRNKACQVFREVLHLDLWDHIRSGHLRYTTVRERVFLNESGDEEVRDMPITENYGRINGQDFLRARYPRLGFRLDKAAEGLRTINFGSEFSEIVARMSDQDRADAAKILAKSIETANTAITGIRDLRQFTSPATIATLNGWARTEGAPVHFHLTFDGSTLGVGRREHEYRRIPVPPEYSLVLRELPKLGLLRSAVA